MEKLLSVRFYEYYINFLCDSLSDYLTLSNKMNIDGSIFNLQWNFISEKISDI